MVDDYWNSLNAECTGSDCTGDATIKADAVTTIGEITGKPFRFNNDSLHQTPPGRMILLRQSPTFSPPPETQSTPNSLLTSGFFISFSISISQQKYFLEPKLTSWSVPRKRPVRRQ